MHHLLCTTPLGHCSDNHATRDDHVCTVIVVFTFDDHFQNVTFYPYPYRET